MILTDYFRSNPDRTWDFAKQCGVNHGVIRLPEDPWFSLTDESHWRTVYDRFLSKGITPVVVEPMPNAVHDHIKAGDELRDASIQQVIDMLPIMDKLNIRTICFNFMAHIGWLRTSQSIPERGDALVTGFDLKEFQPVEAAVTQQQMWDNYEYFIKAVIPYAERYGIKLALHPDDPPLDYLGNVGRIMISYENIRHAVRDIVQSDFLGVTYCQACYHMMGEDVYTLVKELADKIMFVHFRNAAGNKYCFRETFHDNGELDMHRLLNLYHQYTPDVPIRVDHVPLMAGETNDTAGYTALGRLYAIGYLKGLLEAVEKEMQL